MTSIAPEVLAVLRGQVEIDDTGLRITGQLDPKMYGKVKKVLAGLGWKWHTGKQTHLPVTASARDNLAAAVGAGTYVDPAKDESYYATPAQLAQRVVDEALGSFPDGSYVLEPSAGDGALVRAILLANPTFRVGAVEPNPDRVPRIPKGDRVTVFVGTFEEYAAAVGGSPTMRRPDAVVMNPPFNLPGRPTAWIRHLELAWDVLAPGGRLVCIAPVSFDQRQDRRHTALRQWVTGLGGSVETLPIDAFKESGTGVRTVLITLDKPRA